MPSIFTRSRTASTPSKAHNGDTAGLPADEFGRVTSRGSTHGGTTSKKDKKKDKERQRTQSVGEETPPDGSFLPFSWGSPMTTAAAVSDEGTPKMRSYGYLSYKCEVVLGIEEVSRLVQIISLELNERGLTTPLLFSNTALDISRSRIHRLIDTFLDTCPEYRHQLNSQADLKWRDEARFAGPHELGMTLRWGLARLVRIHHAQETHGFVSWECYLNWREDEATANYPADAFHAFLPAVSPQAQPLLLSLLSLLARLTTHANSSGLTPPALSTLFGPLIFGLGSAALPFHHTYGAYLRCSHATEHLLLAYARAQPAPQPKRLLDWIRGYPSMLTPTNRLDKARPGAKIMRLNTVKRNVRLYSLDLVRSAAGWDMTANGSREWGRVTGQGWASAGSAMARLLNGPGGGVKYSDEYRKKMDLPVGAVPDGISIDEASEWKRKVEEEHDVIAGDERRKMWLEKEDERRFGSLTELRWGEFESLGFGGEATKKRLEFDLNEGARTARTEKRGTLTWTDFSASGFSRDDAPLSATLQFSAPLQTTIQAWPQRQTELQQKLKKTQKSLPPFTWDTAPMLGGEEAVEAGFVDVFCDLVYGSGWVDRQEQTWRECNWAVIEYKSIPQKGASLSMSTPPTDPRTATSLWLYEELIPLEYRAQLTAPKRKIPFPFRGATPFHVGSGGSNKPMPRIPNARELEFEGLLKGGNGNVTKVISLNGGGGRTVMMTATSTASEKKRGKSAKGAAPMAISAPLYVVGKDGHSGEAHPHSSSVGTSGRPSTITSQDLNNELPPTPTTPVDTIESVTTAGPLSPARTNEPALGQSQASSNPPRTPVTPTHPPTAMGPASKRSRFPLPSPSLRRKQPAYRPAEYDPTLEFSTRTMWDDGREEHSDEDDDEDYSSNKKSGDRKKKRESRDDAWVDILVGSQSRRMESQAAVMRPGTASGALETSRAAAPGISSAPRNKKRLGMLGSFGEADRVQEEVRQALRDAGPPPESVIDDDEGYRYGSFDATASQYSSETAGEHSGGLAHLRTEGRGTVDSTRPRTSHSLEEEDDTNDQDDEALYGAPERVAAALYTHRRDDNLSLESADFEPMLHMRAPSDRSELGKPQPLPPLSSVPPKPPVKGKAVGSLIEMYREKEKEAATPKISGGSTASSKIPVRVAGSSSSALPPLPAPPHIVPSNAPVPPPHAHLIVDPVSGGAESQSRPLSTMTDDYPVSVADDDDASSVVPSELDEQELEEYLKKNVKISSNTPRYVHGAPLHNVLETEEDDEV